MPQLDLSVFSPQIIWLVITFLILWLMMAKIALPRIGLILEERERKIGDNLEMAENFRKAANTELEAYEKAISEARDKARIVLSETAQQMTLDSATQTAELRDTLAKQIQAAEIHITSAKKEAVEGIRYSAGEVAAAATERLIGVSIPQKMVGAAVDYVLKNGGQ